MKNSKKFANVILASSMLLGLMTNTGAAAVSAAATSESKIENVKPAGIEYQTEGDLEASGTAMDGLDLIAGNQVTRGVLNLDYKVTSFASINYNDHTIANIKLPQEFNELAASGKLQDYISSAHFSYKNTFGGKEYNYTTDDMKVVKDPQDGETYIIKLTNPTISGVGINSTMDVTLSLDLGSMVTDTGIRIPDAADHSAYHLAATVASVDETIDWELVGNTNGTTVIPVYQLDPGYDMLHQVPTIESPVYDDDTVVSGTGVPGATVTIRNGAGEVIGTGVVAENGIYHVTITEQNAGVTLSVTQNTGVGDSQAATTVVQHREANIPAPRVTQPIYEDDTTITGNGYKAGDLVTVTNIETGKSLTTTVQIGGGFEFGIPNGFMHQYDRLHFVESNSDGESSPITEVVVRK